MTHDDIFHRASREIRNSTSSLMLLTAKKYFSLFIEKCLFDGVNPSLVSVYEKAGQLMYESKKLELR